MSPTELLAMLGRAWSRLLLYPAGLTAFAALLVLGRITSPSKLDTQKLSPIAYRLSSLLIIGLPWLGLALLPLPLAAELTRPVDVVVLLSLLEWSRMWAATEEFRHGTVVRAAAMLNSYPALILALLLMAHAKASFEVQALLQAPAGDAALPIQLSFWAGALALLLVLPALLGIGPFSAEPARDTALQIGLGLRAVGIAGMVICPWLSLLPEDYQWLLPGPLMLYGLLLWLFHRRTRHQRALPWAWGLYGLSIVLLVGLLVLNGIGVMEIGLGGGAFLSFEF